MKNIITIFCLFLVTVANGQELKVNVSSDSILLGNYLICTFEMNNLEAEFDAPSFKDFDVVSGPNFSSSFQSINGQTSSSKKITYYLRPKSIGETFIPPSYAVADSITLETQPLSINTYPNPEGIIENPREEQSFGFNSFQFAPFEMPKEVKPKKKKSKSPNKQRKL